MSYEHQEEQITQRGFSLPGMDRKTNVTWALLAINLAVWIAMQLSGGSEEPDVLLRFGAMFGPLIASGEYWRLFTAMFLHVGIMHLLFNGFGLFIFGRLVERIYGPTRFIMIYILAGLSGSVASYTFNSIAIGAGASGAIFGVLGALAAFFLIRRDVLGDMAKQNLIGLLIIIGINILLGFQIANIDNSAHLGGLVGGAILGLAFAPKYQYRSLGDPLGFSYRLVDVTTLVKRWWVVPAVLAVLIAGTWLATSGASDVAQSQTHVVRAERLLGQQDYEGALLEVERAIELDSTNGAAFFIRGKTYAELGIPGRAMPDLSTAIRLGLDSDSRREAIELLLRLRTAMR